ncbi:MAG: methyltransferase [Actinomycetota bacterium]
MSNTNTTNGQSPVTPERIMQFSFAFAPPILIDTAVRHKVFDAIEAGAKTVEEVSAKAETSERGTRILLNAIVGLGLLTKVGDKYLLAPDTAEFLVSGKPSFIGRFFHHTTVNILPKWIQLAEVVKTGKPIMTVNEESDGTKFFVNFVEDLFALNYPPARALAQELQIADAQESVFVLDLAAGSGVWGIALAQASPKVSVTAVDWEGVLPVTKRTAEKFGLGNRFKFVAGDLLSVDFGENHNVVTLGQILHSEGAEKSRQLLKKIFDALAPGGTVAIAEWLVNEDRTAPLPGLIFAVNMLVNTEVGDTFSFEEIKSWLDEAGFENARLVNAPGVSPLILATRTKA